MLDDEVKKAIDAWERLSQDPDKLFAYEAKRKVILDEKSALKRAETIGRQKGFKIGLQEGRKEFMRDMALRMIKKGIDSNTISDLTGLTKEEIKDLKH